MRPPLAYFSATLVLSAMAVVYVVGQGWPARPGPRLDRSSPAASRPAPGPPSARELLDRGRALGLRPEQRAQLEALDARWRREAHDLDIELQAEARELSSFMEEAQDRRGATLAELQRRSAEYRELSAELRERRLRHAREALALLTAAQRQAVSPASTSSTPGEPR